MTTPGPTAGRTGARQVLTMSLRERGWPEDVTEVTIKDVEAAAVARHVRETGCEGLTVENERLRSALSACGDYIVGLGLPMGARPVWETEYHALIDLIDGLLGGKHYPWLNALAPAVAASEEVEHAAQ